MIVLLFKVQFFDTQIRMNSPNWKKTMGYENLFTKPILTTENMCWWLELKSRDGRTLKTNIFLNIWNNKKNRYYFFEKCKIFLKFRYSINQNWKRVNLFEYCKPIKCITYCENMSFIFILLEKKIVWI